MNRKICRGIAILCAALVLGGVFEMLYEMNVHRKSLKGGNLAQEELIPEENIEISEVRAEDELSQTEKEPRRQYHITIKERYIHKFKYTYRSEENFIPDISIHTKNIYKNPEVRKIKDINRSNLNQSVINIKDYVTEIIIEVPEKAELTDFAVDNRWDFNWYRFFYVSMFAALVLYIVSFRYVIAEKTEYGFLAVCLGCGLLFIAIQPPECTSWDEHIHFNKVFDWFDTGMVEQSQSEYYMYYNPESVERSAFLSKEEKALQIQYLNENTNNMTASYGRGRNPLNAVGELHMAAAVKIASWLHLPFYVQFVIGKLTNLFMYAFIMFWAIRTVPVGKRFFTVIALTPTAMLQSVSFTYDVVLIGFTGLGFALIMAEFYDLHRKLTWKRALLIAAVFIIGTCPKPVYIPLLAMLLVLPKEKFKSQKQAVLFKCGALCICFAMIMTMLLPAASGGVQGDARGGATNVTQQLSMVLHHPLAYVRIFFENFKRTLNNYMFGRENISHLAYAGIHPFDSVIGIFCVGVALTEKKKKLVLSPKDKILFKGLLSVIIFAIIGLIWSALYIVFTPVGATVIAGVQGRYFIPLLFPLFMIFYTDRTEGKWKESTYNMILFLAVLWFAHEAMYTQYFLAFCQ